MKKYLIGSILCLLLTSSFAQTVTYVMPQSIRTPMATFSFEKVKATGTSYYVNYKAKNTGDGVLVIERSEATLVDPAGESRPTKQQSVIKTGKSKTIINQFKVKSPSKANAEQFDLSLYGIKYAAATGNTLPAEKLILAEKATQNIGDFAIKILEYNVYDDRIYANIKCTYNGGVNRVGNINLNKLNVSGGSAEWVKRNDVLFSGKWYDFSINIKPDGTEASVDWTGVFEVMNLVDVQIEKLNIKSTTFKEPASATAATTTTTAPAAAATTTTNCALSYNEFNKLKADIQSEVNSGGQPVAMANEYLSVKGCINTAQVAELMGAFTLDAPRLEFAKVAYKYTSDKNKYPQVLQQLSYNNNKQALEEFLGQQ